METVALTWPQVDRLVKVVSAKLSAIKDPALYCIPRGGLIVGALVGYQSPQITKHSFYTPQSGWVAASVVVVIDDIVDTGKEMAEVVDFLDRGLPTNTKIITCSLVTRHNTPKKPLISGMVYPGDEWLIFPWAPNDTKEPTP